MLAVIGYALLKFVLIAFGWVMLVASVLTVIERKQSAAVQNRVGPNRALIFGLRFPLSAFVGQIAADALKVFVKEDYEPPNGNKILHQIAPGLVLMPALLMWLVIPFGPGPKPGYEGTNWFQIADLNAGVLFIFAMAGIGVYGNTLGAWASNSGYALLGGLRTAAQMISYEVSLGLNLVPIFMIFGSLALNDVVWAQDQLLWGWLPKWGIFLNPLAFVLFLAASIAETKRAPFDLPEAESELVAGYHTEYSGMRFATFSLGEFIAIIVTAAVVTSLFLGGWSIPWAPTPVYPDGTPNAGNPVLGWFTVAQVASFLVKMLFVIWIQMQIRWTLPRFRYDQVMRLGWVYILPLSLANVVVTAIVLYLVR